MAGSSDQKDEMHLEEAENVEWLVEMVNSSDPKTGSIPRIQRVPSLIRDIDANKGCFDPMMVSLGPYHRDQEHLKLRQAYKEVAARWFIQLSAGTEFSQADWKRKAPEIYKKFEDELRSNSINTSNNPDPTEAKCSSTDHNLKYSWYAPVPTMQDLSDEDFVQMMFLDGCFILYVFHLVVNFSPDMNDPLLKEIPAIVRDMFLLENQVPYVVLKALMNLMQQPNQGSSNQSNGKGKRDQSVVIQRNIIEIFIEVWFVSEDEPTDSSSPRFYHLLEIFGRVSCKLCGRRYSANTDVRSNFMETGNVDIESLPLHLLDILRNKLIGGEFTPCHDVSVHDVYFRSVTELKTAGIRLCKSHSKQLTGINFTEGFFHGRLSLPQLNVGRNTGTRLLNLIAYEMCPEWPFNFNRVVSSYVWLLDRLIDHLDDVKELRSKRILHNNLGSDEAVAKLFNELGNSVFLGSFVYADVRSKIDSHCRTYHKVWFGEMRNTYFRSPWTVISLIAAIILLFLAGVQSFYTVWPRR